MLSSWSAPYGTSLLYREYRDLVFQLRKGPLDANVALAKITDALLLIPSTFQVVQDWASTMDWLATTHCCVCLPVEQVPLPESIKRCWQTQSSRASIVVRMRRHPRD
jgi:hypothetical protein